MLNTGKVSPTAAQNTAMKPILVAFLMVRTSF
jgi:hypothetical protein